MGVELIRKAVCDRCGRECSYIEEKTLHEEVCEHYDVKVNQFYNNKFHYTEMTLQGFDDRFDCRKDTFILCGLCVFKLGKWLENKEIEEGE